MFANEGTSSTSTILLGKRKRQETYVLHLYGGSAAETNSDRHSEYEDSEQGWDSKRNAGQPKLSKKDKSHYLCEFEGCGKAYKKP